ncbi:MAG: hypothetical protein VYC11_05150 [Candidatus Thermoplasmatota archaeon]|nr:hypothetical protein [Candidatus Thermoplasmatota archaeon]
MSLLEIPAYSSVADSVREAALKLRTSGTSVTISAPLDEYGIFSSALIEAAFLDAGIPYQRRLRNEPTPGRGTSVVIHGDRVSALPQIESNPLKFSIHPVEVDALIASGGDVRKGLLSPVAISAALSASISPSGNKTRNLLPWALVGNWLSEGLEYTYDPVYTVLRDYLCERGIIRVVALPEVIDVEPRTIPGIDSVALDAVRRRWSKFDLEGRAQSLSHLLKPLLHSETLSTARLEELGWHRILAPGWESDMASQIERFLVSWKSTDTSKRQLAGDAIDNLLRTGRLA